MDASADWVIVINTKPALASIYHPRAGRPETGQTSHRRHVLLPCHQTRIWIDFRHKVQKDIICLYNGIVHLKTGPMSLSARGGEATAHLNKCGATGCVRGVRPGIVV